VNDTFDRVNGLVPALSIPMDKKVEFSCPHEHIKKLQELLPNVTKVLVIGWPATEADFLNMLRTELSGAPELMLVSGDRTSADETLRNLDPSQARYPSPNCVDNGFSGLIIEKLSLLDVFLRRPTS
jgi:hypothetical protein